MIASGSAMAEPVYLSLRPAVQRIFRPVQCLVTVTCLSRTGHCVNIGCMVTKTRVMPKILVVDDEPDAVELIDFNLKAAGYDVVTAADGNEALKKARSSLPDLIVLDLMLPEVDGLEVCKILRRDPATAAIPIIMVTAKAAELDRILGLELGANDYVTKPFSPRELVLRVKNLLTRTGPVEEKKDRYEIGEMVIDISRHMVTIN